MIRAIPRVLRVFLSCLGAQEQQLAQRAQEAQLLQVQLQKDREKTHVAERALR